MAAGFSPSIQCRETGIAWAVALALLTPLDSVDYWRTDGNDVNNGILPDWVQWFVHRLPP